MCIKGDNKLLASKKLMIPSQNLLIMFIQENDSGEMEGEQENMKRLLADEHYDTLMVRGHRGSTADPGRWTLRNMQKGLL